MDIELKKWNRLIQRQDEFYHKAAKKSGLADAQFWILYAICESDNCLCQNSFCENWCYSKQTASAAVASLQKSGLVYLTYAEGSRKKKDLHLTEKGEEFCDLHIRTLQTAETQVVLSLSREERDTFFRLYEKLLKGLENS